MRASIFFILLFSVFLRIFSQNNEVLGNNKIELPQYDKSKSQIPELILADKPNYVTLYNEAWKSVFSNMQAPPADSKLKYYWLDEGLCPQVIQWDTNFSIMFGRYINHIYPFILSHDNFYAVQHEDGMICRVLNLDGSDHYWGQGPDNARAINPPLYTWAEWENYLVTGDDSRFEKIIPVLEKYGEFIDKNRIGYDTPHKLYWSNGQASGMDNTPRDVGRPEPGDGWDYNSAIDHMGWIDLSSQMVMYYHYLSLMCDRVGEKSKAKKYSSKAENIKKLINQWMWDETSGLYYDVDTQGVRTRWITAATFWPLLAGVSDSIQSNKLVDNLLDPNLFWRRTPVPSLAYGQEYYCDSGRYWQGGTWAPLNYMIVQGLVKNGYEKDALDLTYKYLDAIWRVFLDTGYFWEVYSAEMYIPSTQASGVLMCKKNYMGWTALAPISMMIENVIGLRCDAEHNRIVWNITQQCEHGMKNFHFNGKTIDLMAKPSGNDSYVIEVNADKTFDLQLKCLGKVRELTINKGKNSFLLTKN